MNAEGWRDALLLAYHRREHYDDSELLDGLARQLAEEDAAKQLLHDAGFGVTGTSLLVSVRNALG